MTTSDAVDEARTEAILFETLYAETPPEQHGQLCPVWTKRKQDPSLQMCDCWVEDRAHRRAQRLAAAIAANNKRPVAEHHPGDPHHYRLECDVCGQPGQVQVSVEPQTTPFLATHSRYAAEPLGVTRTRSADAPRATSSDGGSPETERAMASATPERIHPNPTVASQAASG